MPDRPASPGSRLSRARGVARLLDDLIRIPGTNIGIGLDPVIGLIPGAGDVLGGVLSGYILLLAAQEGAPSSVLLRMLGNIATDSLVGVIPVIGDLFDVGIKSNRRNVELLERYLGAPDTTTAASRWTVAAVVLALLLILIAVVAAGVWVVRLLARAIG